MGVNYLDRLIDHFDQLSVFSSIYESRILGALIVSPQARTAAQLSSELDIPDSKVYPALNILAEKSLITVDSHSRPKYYRFDRPEQLLHHLQEKIQSRYVSHNQLIEDIRSITNQIWEPEEFMLDNIALLYRGDEIRNELARHLKLTQDRLFIFLSTQFLDHYDLLKQYLPEISHDQFELHLVIPTSHDDLIPFLEDEVKGRINLRTSIWNQNSYIIRDRSVMMNIFHSDEDVALLTNERLMVKNVEACWDDPDCCTTTALIDLQLPDDFTFSTINFP